MRTNISVDIYYLTVVEQTKIPSHEENYIMQFIEFKSGSGH